VIVVRVAAALLEHIDRCLSFWLRAPAWLRWCLPLLVVAMLWWSSARSPEPSEPSVVRELLHNGMHAVAFAVLAAAIRLAVAHGSAAAWALPKEAVAWCLAVTYGVVDELHQGQVPGRVCSASDVVTDAAGAVFGVLLLAAARRWPMAWSRVFTAAAVCLLCAVNATFASW
jgi:VanZ family protein